MKVLKIIILMLALVLTLASCEGFPSIGNGNETSKEPKVEISEDGYIVIDGKKTEYEVKHKNHTFGDWELYNEDETNCEKKLYYRICSDCSTIEWKDGKYEDHDFNTFTIDATCQYGGNDTKICKLCGKFEVCNATPALDHSYSPEYVSDDIYHWKKCRNCDNTTKKIEHTVGDNNACTVCNATLGETEGIIYEISSDGTYAMVMLYSGTATNVRIAKEYQGLPVKTIYNDAFESTTITTVVIPNSVTSIGDAAFSNCRNLISVTIPNSVTSIGIAAFSGCSSLTSIALPESVTWVGDAAFCLCTSLESITIPKSGILIGNDAFYNCNASLYTESNYSQYVKANGNPYAILTEVTNRNLSTYVISSKTEIVTGSVFADCERLTSIIIPDSVTSIGDGAFENCSILTSVTLGNLVTSIGAYAFRECSSLTGITIPDSVTSIGDEAFAYCSSLTSIIIPDSVTSIGEWVFSFCSSLTSVVISDSITSIVNGMFDHCSSLTSVIIPNSVTSIGDRAFQSCSKLTHITIPDSVTSIESEAFNYCGIKSIIIPDSVISIGNKPFHDCGALATVYYTGSEEEWKKILNIENIDLISFVNIIYNYTPEK